MTKLSLVIHFLWTPDNEDLSSLLLEAWRVIFKDLKPSPKTKEKWIETVWQVI